MILSVTESSGSPWPRPEEFPILTIILKLMTNQFTRDKKVRGHLYPHICLIPPDTWLLTQVCHQSLHFSMVANVWCWPDLTIGLVVPFGFPEKGSCGIPGEPGSALRPNCQQAFSLFSFPIWSAPLTASVKYQNIQLILSINQAIQWMKISKASCLSAHRKAEQSNWKILNNDVKVNLWKTDP